MLKNFIQIAFRNLRKQKLYSIINITGLSLALAVTMFGVLFVSQELSFDKFHEDEERIFRVITVFGEGARQQGSLSEVPATLKPILTDQVPEIEAITRIETFKVPIKRNNASFNERVFFVENEYFSIFSFDLTRGDKLSVLKSPDEVVISQRMAEKYFGDQNPVGEVLSIYLRSSFHDFTVAGVIENAPDNSSIQHDFLFPYQWLINLNTEVYELNKWAPDVFTFVKLNESAGSASEVNKKIAPIIETARGTFMEERGMTPNAVTFELQPLSLMHLSTDVRNWPNTTLLGPSPSNILYSYILISIAFVILVIACINYTTYSIGYSIHRSMEVGIRKTLGAGKGQIMFQFWAETLVVTFISLSVGIALLQMLLPVLNNTLGLALSMDALISPLNLIILLGLWLLVGLLAGSYPSLIISRFEPQRVLKGKSKGNTGDTLSKLLVGVQYVGVFILMISLITIVKQLNHIQSKSFGDEEEQTLIIRNQQYGNIPYITAYERIKSEMEVKGYSQVTASFGAVNDDLFMMNYKKAESGDEPLFTRAFFVDHNYLNIYDDINLIAGRFFEENRTADQAKGIVVNETFARELGLSDPVGSILQSSATMIHEDGQVEIIGVVEDFHFESLHTSIAPAVFIPIRNSVPTRYISIKFPASSTEETVEDVRSIWAEVLPGLPFEYTFLDQRYEAFYTSEQRWKNIATYATILGILISIMGIVALTGLSANNQRKEIGIRKILGASISDIMLLLGKQFLLSLAFAFLAAAPIAHYLMNRWLQNFSYAIDIGLLPYIIAGCLTLFVTILAFSQQALTAALANPVDSLKNE